MEFSFTAPKCLGEQKRRAWMVVVPNRRLKSFLFNPRIFHTGIFGNDAAHFDKHLGGMFISPKRGCLSFEPLFDAQRQVADNPPVGPRFTPRLDRAAYALNAPVGIRESAVFFR